MSRTVSNSTTLFLKQLLLEHVDKALNDPLSIGLTSRNGPEWWSQVYMAMVDLGFETTMDTMLRARGSGDELLRLRRLCGKQMPLSSSVSKT